MDTDKISPYELALEAEVRKTADWQKHFKTLKDMTYKNLENIM